MQWTLRIARRSLELGQRHDDLAVEAAGAQQGGVEDVGPVGGRHHHDALGGLEAVHLGEHLVERLLALVVAAAEAGAALAADRVDLVDEDDRPAQLAGVWNRSRTRLAPTPTNISMKSEPVTDRNGTPASPATARAMSVLPVPGGPTSSTPLGMRAPISPNCSGVFRKSTTSRDLLLHALVAGDVGEGRARPLGGVGLGPRAADRHDPAHLALRPALHDQKKATKMRDREQERQERGEEVGCGVLYLTSTPLSREDGEVGVGQAAVERAGGAELRAVRRACR